MLVYNNPSIFLKREIESNEKKNCFPQFYFKKILEVAKGALQGIVSPLSFPMRYIGAKTWSLPGVIFRLRGAVFRRIFLYESSSPSLKEELFGKRCYSSLKTNFEELKATGCFDLACSIMWVERGKYEECAKPFVSCGYKIITELEIDDSLVKANEDSGCFFNKKSGLKIAIMERMIPGQEAVIISFGSQSAFKKEVRSLEDRRLQSRLYWRGWENSISNEFGIVPSFSVEADKLIGKIKALPQFTGKKIVLTGLCSGGALASFLALKHQLYAFCVNSRPLGAWAQRELGWKVLQNAQERVTYVLVEGDILSTPSFWTLPIQFLDKVCTFIGIRTPGRFGKRYLVSPPKEYSKQEQKHAWVSGIFMNLFGYPIDKTPTQLPLEQLQALVM